MSMELLETIELGATATSITFSDIPADGDHLLLKASIRCATKSGIFFWLNGSQVSFTTLNMTGTGTAISNDQTASSTIFSAAVPNSFAANTFSNVQIQVADYSKTPRKSILADCVQENTSSSANMTMTGARWFNNAIVSSLTIYGQNYAGNELLAGSTFSLYKITGA